MSGNGSSNRAAEYRRRAEDARAKGKGMPDEQARASLLHDAEMWERMAAWEDKKHPPPSPQTSD
ncbi:MAG: hypothetical protein JOY64_35410 [Alphaproteobacteria bacterium]|nr:hypothetical protein [Alphaproteobacteria bacterium]MBV8412956.1 hypothetical protein [Alphaproteobacteria bacterium]